MYFFSTVHELLQNNGSSKEDLDQLTLEAKRLALSTTHFFSANAYLTKNLPQTMYFQQHLISLLIFFECFAKPYIFGFIRLDQSKKVINKLIDEHKIRQFYLLFTNQLFVVVNVIYLLVVTSTEYLFQGYVVKFTFICNEN